MVHDQAVKVEKVDLERFESMEVEKNIFLVAMEEVVVRNIVYVVKAVATTLTKNLEKKEEDSKADQTIKVVVP